MMRHRLVFSVFRGADTALGVAPGAKDDASAVRRRFHDVAAFLGARAHAASPGPKQASRFGTQQAPRQCAGRGQFIIVVTLP